MDMELVHHVVSPFTPSFASTHLVYHKGMVRPI